MPRERIFIEVSEEKFSPGSELDVLVRWEFDEVPDGIDCSLIWHTSGKGTEDAGAGVRHEIAAPSATGEERVTLEVPSFPYSFSGKLISLQWEVEARVLPKGPGARRSIVIAPGGEEILL